jgi:hypothetical protein
MDSPKPLECSEAGRRDILLALLQHRLNEEEEDRILKHLRRCPYCLSVMATILSEARTDSFGNGFSETRRN